MSISIVSRVVEWERSNLCICHNTLLRLVVWMLLRVRLVHVERTWRHVSASCSGQRL